MGYKITFYFICQGVNRGLRVTIMSNRKTKLNFQTILLSLFGFVLLWAIVTDAWGYSSNLTVNYGNYIYAVISRLIWVAPAIWLIYRYSDSLTFDKQELFRRPVWNKSMVIVLIISIIISLTGMLVTHGGFWLNPTVCIPLEIIKIFFVGFVEEMVFRGWGYNALSATVMNRKAVISSTIFFVLLHSPAYFVRFYRFGTMDYSTWLIQSVTTAIWGVVFCWLLKKSRTIWNPIIAHIVYDILTGLFVG